MGLYNIFSSVPLLGSIIRWILKKAGKLKDYEDIYQTDNGLKVFANSLKKIGVSFEKYIQEKKKEIPLIFLFKNKTDHPEFKSDKLKSQGFKYFNKSMGLWILPPEKVKEYKLRTPEDIEKFLIKMINKDNSHSVNMRFAFMIDYKDIFYFPKDKNEFLDFIAVDIIKFFGKNSIIKYAQKVVKNQTDIIKSTPLQHMFADFVSPEGLDKLSEKEDTILSSLEKKGSIKKPYFLHLKDIDKNILMDELKNHSVDVTLEIVDKAKKQADFIVNKIHLE